MTRLERYREKLARLEEKRGLLMRSGRYLESNALNDDIKDVERAIREAEEYEERCRPRSLKDTVSKEELDEMGIIPLMIVCHLASDFLTGVCYDIVDRCKAHGFTDVRLMPELKKVLSVNNRFASALTEMGPSLSKIITGNETLNEAILKKYITYIEQRLTPPQKKREKEMTLYWISYGLMTVAVVVLYIINRRLIKALRNSNDCLKSANFLIGKFGADKIDYDLSIMHKAEVEERTEFIPYFAVYRKGLTEKHDIIRVGYDPTDPDDRDYKRVHAEELAEMLNEKP